ncbi:MAG TPA: ATP-binding protein [Dissulfurispiraceae bacterium]|nr:ATP-binding protein [Dissulfurispiraceae bacterium]
MITTDVKKQIVEAINARRGKYASDAKMAISLGISAAQLSTIKRGQLDKVLSDANWISIARMLDVQLGRQQAWKTAATPVFAYIYSQLTWCQDNGQSGLLCDRADVGKTYTAKCYVKERRNAVYIDCSQVKTRQKLIRQMAREYGLNHTGRYNDVYDDLVYYLRTIETPLIILDESGDLDYPAFLELKALWNATERACGWFMMGADGLRRKIEIHLSQQKVGYQELFSRFGNRYQRISPDGKDAYEEFMRAQIALIARANDPEADIQKLYVTTGGSLRRIPVELKKQAEQKKQNPAQA